MTDSSLPLLQVADDVAVLELQSQAYEIDGLSGIARRVAEVEAQPDLKALILTGSAGTFFRGASGALLQHMRRVAPAETLEIVRTAQANVLALARCSKFTVAHLNGFTAGGGVDLALACDRVYVTDATRVNLFYSKLGLVPDNGALWFLATRLGWSKALEIALRSPNWSKQDCMALGLGFGEVPLSLTPAQWREELRGLLRAPANTIAASKALRFEAQREGLESHLEQVAQHMLDLLHGEPQGPLLERVLAMQRIQAG